MKPAELYSNCKSALRTIDNDSASRTQLETASQCLAFVQGVTETAAIIDTPPQVCLTHASEMAVVKAYVGYMDRNPARFDDAVTAIGVIEALKESFPCSK